MARKITNKERLKSQPAERFGESLGHILSGETLYRTSDGRTLDFKELTDSPPTNKISMRPRPTDEQIKKAP